MLVIAAHTHTPCHGRCVFPAAAVLSQARTAQAALQEARGFTATVPTTELIKGKRSVGGQQQQGGSSSSVGGGGVMSRQR